MTEIFNIKLIIESEFNAERQKNRGSAITNNEVGNALTAIEIEIQKKLKRLEAGEQIDNILPELKDNERASRT